MSRQIFVGLQRLLQLWGRKIEDLWHGPIVSAKILAIVWGLGGIMLLAVGTYLLLYLLPIFILILIVQAVWMSIK